MRRLMLTVLSIATCTVANAAQFSALVFTKTDGWHHDSINAAVDAMEKLGQRHDFDVFWTEDANRVFNDRELAKYQVVMFLLTTGDVLNDQQQAAFERYMRRGGGFVGVHSASDTEYNWPWYTKMIGHMFRIHPVVQTAALEVKEYNFPGMDRFAPRFLFTEEWYEFDASRSDQLHYLLAVDETTYKPQVEWADRHVKGVGMGSFHPISWYQNYDGGRAFYTALGHLPGAYSDDNFLHHIYGGLYWAATGNGFKAKR